jgi:hypothetical protein
MRLASKEERDQAGFALELIRRTILSHSPHSHTKQWKEAQKLLGEAQQILIETGFYSDDFNPSLASY